MNGFAAADAAPVETLDRSAPGLESSRRPSKTLPPRSGAFHPTDLAPASPKRRALLAAGTGALGWPIGAPAAAATRAIPLRVVASFSILADIARQVAGDLASVDALVGPDADTHVFEPTPMHARRLAEADLVVVNGLGFEGWMPRLVAASGYRGPVLTASRGIAVRRSGGAGGATPSIAQPPRRSGGTEEADRPEGDSDPHVWLDLSNGRRMALNIAEALRRLRPDASDAIERRSMAYAAALDTLDRTIRARLDRIPRAARRVVSPHEAFGYFGAAYGVDFEAPLPANNQSEPSAATVARLIGRLRGQGVRAVFVENTADPRLVARIARDAGIAVGGTLYADALSRPQGDAGTYLALIAHNATTIAQALGG